MGCSKHELNSIADVVLPKRNLSSESSTSLQWPLSSVPVVAVVETFDCIVPINIFVRVK